MAHGATSGTVESDDISSLHIDDEEFIDWLQAGVGQSAPTTSVAPKATCRLRSKTPSASTSYGPSVVPPSAWAELDESDDAPPVRRPRTPNRTSSTARGSKPVKAVPAQKAGGARQARKAR